MWIDLGEPILFLILLSWALFFFVAIFWTFLDKKNRQGFKEFLNQLTQPNPHNKPHKGRDL